MPAVRSLTLHRGDRHVHEVRLRTYDEEANLWAPVNISGFEYEAIIYESASDQTELLAYTVSVTSASGGYILCELSSASVNLLAIGTYFHVFRDITNDLRILTGPATVRG